MRNLMLMRHGKSDWDAGAPDDHSRPLNGRGRRSAERMGEVLRDRDLIPDLVVSSTATRARTTAELARIAGGWASRLVLEDELYGASVGETIAVAARYGADHQRIMLVGHQPTWSMTVRHLTNQSADIRTGTVADMEVPIDMWSELGREPGTLIHVLQPRDYLADSDDAEPGP